MQQNTLATLILSSSLALSVVAAQPVEPPMRTLVNFDGNLDEPRWVAVNDGVMGGVSRGGPTLSEGQLRFSGELSLANNGGFSSVRSLGRRYDLSGAEAVVLRVRGDGRRYQLRLATDARYRGMPVSFGAEFDTVAGRWVEVRIPIRSLAPTVRGFSLLGPAMDPRQVREIGLLISDKLEGAFVLTVDWIGVE